MRISSLSLTNWKKHRQAEFNFESGVTLIVGPNYSGKSSILQAILVCLWGSNATPAPTKLLVSQGAKDYHIKLTLTDTPDGKDRFVERTSKDASITRDEELEPYVRGHMSVTKAISELFEMDRNTFLNVYTSEQGSPQQLLQMEGAQLQKFIEQVTGLDKLEDLQRSTNRVLYDLQYKATTLSDMLLPDQEYKGLIKSLEDLGINENALQEQRSLLTARVQELQGHINALESNLASIRIDNQKASAWLTKRAQIEAKLSATPLLEEMPTTKLSEEKASAEFKVDLAKKEFMAQSELNSGIHRYEETLARIDAELSSLQPALNLPDVDTEALSSEVDELKSSLSALSKANTDRVNLKNDCLKVKGSLQSLAEEYKSLPEEKPLHNLELAASQIKNLTEDLHRLTEEEGILAIALHEAVCPTCNRPFDLSFPRDSLDSKLKECSANRENCEYAISVLTSEYGTMEAENEGLTALHERRTQLLLVWGKLEEKVQSLETSIIEISLGLEEHPHQTQLRLDQMAKDLDVLHKQYSEAVYKKTEKRLATERTDTLLSEKSKLKKPEGELKPLLDLKKSLEEATEHQIQATTSLNAATEHNVQARKNNQDRQAYLDELDLMPLDKAPAIVDTQEQEILLSSARERLSEDQATLADVVAQMHLNDLDAQPLTVAVKRQEELLGLVSVNTKSLELYKFLSTLISNSRAGFIGKAYATVLHCCSEFASLSTGGDIEEVLIHEGSICYREGGVIFSKLLASGAQKSIIGLGMKLGIANLITSPFNDLLLDEISSDMTPEVSLNCMQALSSTYENALVVTHRDMDVGGNVITLG